MNQTVRIDKRSNPSSHGFMNMIYRAVWSIVWFTLFRFSPKIMYGWRRVLLRLFGAEIGKQVKIMPSTCIWLPSNMKIGNYSVIGNNVNYYNVDLITIGEHVTISQYSFLCTASHNPKSNHMKLCTGKIIIKNQAWIAADVFIGQNVTIGEGCVVGARSSVFRNLPEWHICMGTPAKPVHSRIIDNNE